MDIVNLIDEYTRIESILKGQNINIIATNDGIEIRATTFKEDDHRSIKYKKDEYLIANKYALYTYSTKLKIGLGFIKKNNIINIFGNKYILKRQEDRTNSTIVRPINISNDILELIKMDLTL